MKEFVAKLIERLEYLRKDKYVMVPTVCYVLENVEEIVNQLAEEYKGNLSENLTGWIPVTERLPEENERVLCVTKKNRMETAIYRYGGFWACGSNWLKQTVAWQPLPEPYKECEVKQGLYKLSQEPKTRIERIRYMSVEELADTILERSEISTAIDFCQNFCGECENIPESECKKCLIKYLNSPVEQKKTIPTDHFKERLK